MDPKTARDFLTFADIGKGAAEGEASPIGFKEIMDFIKALSAAFKDGREMMTMLRGGGVSEEVTKYRELPSKQNTKPRQTAPSTPTASPLDDYGDLMEKGVTLLSYLKGVLGDVPISVVIEALTQLNGGKPNENKDVGETGSDLRTEGDGENRTLEIYPPSTTKEPSSGPIGGVQPQEVQSLQAGLHIESQSGDNPPG